MALSQQDHTLAQQRSKAMPSTQKTIEEALNAPPSAGRPR